MNVYEDFCIIRLVLRDKRTTSARWNDIIKYTDEGGKVRSVNVPAVNTAGKNKKHKHKRIHTNLKL